MFTTRGESKEQRLGRRIGITMCADLTTVPKVRTTGSQLLA